MRLPNEKRNSGGQEGTEGQRRKHTLLSMRSSAISPSLNKERERKMSEKKKRSGCSKWLILLAVAVLIMGLAAEVLLKYETAVLTMTDSRLPPEENIQRQWRRVFTWFGDEAQPLYAVPIYSLKLMSLLPYMTRGGGTPGMGDYALYALRWLPYLALFLLPVLYLRYRKKFMLLIPGIVSLLEAVQIVIVTATVNTASTNYTYYLAIPFFLEALLLLLMCVRLKKGGGRHIGLGAAAAVLAILSPFMTAILFELAGMLRSASHLAEATDTAYNWGYHLLREIRYFPHAYACSLWPVYKTFAFILYALILFSGEGEKLKG